MAPEKKETLPEGWYWLDRAQGKLLTEELAREISVDHALRGKPLVALAKLDGEDDVLYQVKGDREQLYAVHLTWSVENVPDWPLATAFSGFGDFLENWKRIYE